MSMLISRPIVPEKAKEPVKEETAVKSTAKSVKAPKPKKTAPKK